MPSPARAHFIRMSAAAATHAAEGDAIRPDATQYELHLAQLAEHRRRLKQIKSVERKVEAKRKFLPEYQAYLDGVLQGDGGAQDDVVTTLMVWHIDAGDFDGALALGAYVLRHDLKLPDQYQRDAACVLAEEIAEAALAKLAQDHAAATDIQLLLQLVRTADLVKGRDMPDEVAAKLHKAIGYASRADAPADALEELQRALELNPKCGVKKDIERLQREIRNTAAGKSGG